MTRRLLPTPRSNLGHNYQLTGKIPDSWSGLKTLKALDTSGCELACPPPKWMDSWHGKWHRLLAAAHRCAGALRGGLCLPRSGPGPGARAGSDGSEVHGAAQASSTAPASPWPPTSTTASVGGTREDRGVAASLACCAPSPISAKQPPPCRTPHA
jgi:hypothetical protein